MAIRDGFDFVINPNDYIGGFSVIPKYRNNVFRKIKILFIPEITDRYNSVKFEFNELPKLNSSHQIEGYFQSEKYFKNYRKEILELFEIQIETKNKLISLYPFVFDENDLCSIHIRRGDYLHLQNHHPVISIDYYKKAIEYFDKKTKFIIFSDDISWCGENFNFIENKVFIHSLEDYEELYLMSYCKNNIIANSSFSWWGGWLNNHEDKIIIAPKVWFGDSYSSYKTDDLIPENWIKI